MGVPPALPEPICLRPTPSRRGLRRNYAWSPARRALLGATGLAWIGLLAFEVSFAIMVPGRELGPDVPIGWPNRFLIGTYGAWLMLVAGTRHGTGPMSPEVSPRPKSETRGDRPPGTVQKVMGLYEAGSHREAEEQT